MFARIREEEDGVAMIVALMVCFVVLLLGVVVMAQATHNVQQAGYDRKRLTAIGGAEAGIDYMYNYFQKTSAATVSLDPVSSAVSIGTFPNTTTYDTSVTYYGNSTGTVPSVWPFSNSNYPSSAKVVSVGTSSDGTKRVMETFMVLHPVLAGTSGAIVTNSDTQFSGNFTVSGVDSDVYVLSGNFTALSGLESINGSIYVPQGSANIGTNVAISGQVFARDLVTLNHPQLVILGDVKSSTAGVTKTAGTVLGQIHYCPPGTAPAGAIADCPSPVPGSSVTFPQLTYNQTTWGTLQSDGTKWYQEPIPSQPGKTQCDVAQGMIEAGGANTTPPAGYTGVVYYLDSGCNYLNSPSAGTISMNGDLAIVAPGGITLANSAAFTGVGSSRKLILMAPWPPVGSPCTSPMVQVSGNTDFINVTGFVYSSCRVDMSNNNAHFTGQVVGQQVTIGNQFGMTYQEMLVPGMDISGFREDVAYIREVTCQNPASATCT